MVICMFFIDLFFENVALGGDRRDLNCDGLVSCINQFFNKYNWLCVLGGSNVQRKTGAVAGLFIA